MTTQEVIQGRESRSVADDSSPEPSVFTKAASAAPGRPFAGSRSPTVRHWHALLEAAMYFYRNYQDAAAYGKAIRHLADRDPESAWDEAERRMVEHYERNGSREIVGDGAVTKALRGAHRRGVLASHPRAFSACVDRRMGRHARPRAWHHRDRRHPAGRFHTGCTVPWDSLCVDSKSVSRKPWARYGSATTTRSSSGTRRRCADAPSVRRAAWCNEYVMRHCDRLMIGHLKPGGMLECLLSDAPAGLNFAFLNTPNNASAPPRR